MSGPLREALALHQAGRLAEAAERYAAVLEVQPDQFDALHFSGVLALQQGDAGRALERLKRAVAQRPDSPDAWCNLGLAQLTGGESEAAAAAFGEALQREPGLAPALNGLTRAYLDAGDRQGARRQARRAVNRLVGDPTAWRVLGEVESAGGSFAAAVHAYQEAVHLAPGDAELQYNLGVALEECGRWDEAQGVYVRALERDPQLNPALSNLVFLKRSQCDWHGLDALQDQLLAQVDAGMGGVTPFLLLAISDDRARQRRCAETYTRQFTPPARPFAHGREPEDRITVGYLSSGFYRYPTATLIPGVIEQHDRARFRVLGLSTGPDDGSAERKRLEGAFDEWLELKDVPAFEAARRIHAAGVDILVDLKGHSDDAPTAITALRPAPVQACWVGYPGTTGADFVDYLIADGVVIPPEHEADYREAVVRLDTCYQPNDDRRARPEARLTRAECGLPEDAPVLCCFNNLYKLGPETFGRWLDVLKAVPDAVLWLLAPKSGQGAPARLAARAQAAQIAPERLIFAPRRPRGAYLDQLRLADLMLDTFPYNAHTTASEALWMGCPVVTRPGNTFAGRVGASLLRACGLDELVFENAEALKHATIALARDPNRLRALRRHLGSNHQAFELFDTAKTTRSVERAFERMMAHWREGEAPRGFSV